MTSLGYLTDVNSAMLTNSAKLSIRTFERRYCYGPETSTWGAVRKADGHPKPYNKVRL